MVQRQPETPTSLYETDETAWLEQTAELIRSGRLEAIDRLPLAEYLQDMARRDRQEVFSHLVVLLSHLLKWDEQPDCRSRSWSATIVEQQRELRQLSESSTLYNHAQSVLADAYAESRKQAAAETGLARDSFSVECRWDLESVLADPFDHS